MSNDATTKAEPGASPHQIPSAQARRTYNPAKGGHAPGHLRDSFLGWLESPPAEAPIINDEPVNARWLIGQLWNCTDVLPSIYCDLVNLPQGSTYAQAARLQQPALLDVA